MKKISQFNFKDKKQDGKSVLQANPPPFRDDLYGRFYAMNHIISRHHGTNILVPYILYHEFLSMLTESTNIFL